MYKLHIYKKIVLFSLLFFVSLSLNGQNTYKGEVEFRDIKSSRQSEKLTIQFQLDLSEIDLPRQQMILYAPTLQSKDMQEMHHFEPIIITGSVRDKVYQREPDVYYPQNQEILLYAARKNKKKQSYPITLTVNYEDWMQDAELLFHETVSGCALCDLGERNISVLDRVLPEIHLPVYEYQYIMPEAEAVKNRSETHTAHLNFVVGRSELLRNFENNANVLARVDQIVAEIQGDQNLTVQSLEITGYASPEGNFNSNLELSKNRSYAFVNYLLQFHKINASLMKTNWKGEDWEGLRQSVLSSSLPEKDAVIRVIDENYDVSLRKQRLQALNGGSTYRMLLSTLYPPLRRMEYTISYVAKSFSDIEEMKALIKTKPQHLSLNEMFLVANTYPKGSEEFKEIFDIAVRMYPEDPVAKINAATQEIESGAYDRAISRLQGIDLPAAWNNLGIAYAKKENYTRALEYFERAADKGDLAARSNFEQLDNYLKGR